VVVVVVVVDCGVILLHQALLRSRGMNRRDAEPVLPFQKHLPGGNLQRVQLVIDTPNPHGSNLF